MSVTQVPLQACCNFRLSQNQVWPNLKIWVHTAFVDLTEKTTDVKIFNQFGYCSVACVQTHLTGRKRNVC